ncbi:MAG: hypothetical protein B7Z10_08770 [Rhodobacterales bacterium 32-66-7]|nr:MAG: hypothetical protein B7Z10_08770 [Rhodobacterales bacterium 32-66-7]
MTDPNPAPLIRFRTGALSPRRPTRFDFQPDGPALAALAAELGLLAVHRLRFQGDITPAGRGEFALTGTLTADASQACVVTLEPVETRVRDSVSRRYVPDLADPEGDEVEMAPDDTVEPLPEVIDIAEIAAEALLLALPLYPRAPGAELGTTLHAGDGVTPLADSDLRPFAGLADLAARLGKTPGDGGDKG